MLALRQSHQALSLSDITIWLRDLRQHCYIAQSHYAVSCVMEVKLADRYIYAGGVNVENSEHNRLGIHAEQNALVILQSVLGGNVTFSRVWIMAAPESIQAGSNDPLADNLPLSCGHCRQILLSFTDSESGVYGVSCNGAVSQAYDLNKMLPEAFSERDLAITKHKSCVTSPIEMFSHYENNYSDPASHATDVIFMYFSNLLAPHIINTQFITSPIQAVMLKLTNGFYIPGVLVQDIAFLTTDAIFAAIGHAITRFGASFVEVAEVHLYCDDANEIALSASELKLIRHFSQQNIPVYYYQPALGFVRESSLIDVAKQKWEEDFGSNSFFNEVAEFERNFLNDSTVEIASN
jgi:cytidine deaminase